MTLPRSRRFGILLVLVSAVLWSTAGLFVRMAELDTASIIVWRSLFSFAALGAFVAVRRMAGSGRELTFGWPGLLAVAIGVVGAVTYVASLKWTSVANVMTVYAALPFLATGIAYLWLGERVTGRFLLAGGLAFAGIVTMVGAAVAPGDLAGIAAAFVMTASFAAALVTAKRYPTLDMPLATALTAAGCILVALPFMEIGIPEPHQMLACALYGVLTTGVAYALVLWAGRLIGSGEVGFISLLDVVLGPLWVWLAFDERVGPGALVGGATVILAVAWYLLGDRSGKRLAGAGA